MANNKVRPSAVEALAAVVADGQTIAVGGFGLSGNPLDLIEALRDTGVRELTIVSNNMGVDGEGLGLLIENRQVRKVVSSYVGENHLFGEQYLSGGLEVEFCPQGTLAERMRAGGAGIGGFYTRTGYGTPVAEGKPTRVLDGTEYLLERAIVADVAIVKAHFGDREGNLIYRKTARNFNPLAAMCGKITLAEVELLASNYLDPDEIHTPGIFVQHVVIANRREKPIEHRTTRHRNVDSRPEG